MLRRIALSLLVLFAVSKADAATFRLSGGTITMRGEIVAADPLQLAKLIPQGARRIVLDSPGGLVAAASYMSDMIRAAKLTTIVHGDCASACTMMFYAGVKRELTGRLGFHNATDAVGTANYIDGMRRFGAPSEALRAAKRTSSRGITWMR